MKTASVNTRIKNIFIGVLALMMMFSFTSPVIKTNFAKSAVVPDAKGYIKVKKGDNLHYAIQIHFSGLPEANRLNPPKRIYVVWMISDDYVTKNLGPLIYPANRTSKKNKATFETATKLKPSKIFITAEDDAAIARPGVQVILATNRF